jgi:heat shock protein HtpX
MMNNWLKTVVLLGALTAILLWIGSFWGASGLTFALIFVGIMNFVSYFFSDKIVLMMYRAKEVQSGMLYDIVKDVSVLARMPMPKVYTIPTKQANAFATGRNPKHAAVAATDGIMSILSKDELKAVIGHEMGHVKNRDILITTIASVIAGVIGYVAMMARWSAIFGLGGRDDRNGGVVELIVLGVLMPIIATIIRLAISRSREYLADETGAKITHMPLQLASALEKIHDSAAHTKIGFGSETTSSLFIANPFTAKGMFQWLSTHPPVKERVRRLRDM